MDEVPGSFFLLNMMWTSAIFVPLVFGAYAIKWLLKKLAGLSLPLGLLEILCLSASLTLAFLGAFTVPAFSSVIDSYAEVASLALIARGLVTANDHFALWLPLAVFLLLLWRSKRKTWGISFSLSS
jgi:hypothetical protein